MPGRRPLPGILHERLDLAAVTARAALPGDVGDDDEHVGRAAGRGGQRIVGDGRGRGGEQRGGARERGLEFTAEAGRGDFIFVPPLVPHQEINASRDEALACVVVRSGQEPIVVNLGIAAAEPPEEIRWTDPLHG